MVFLKGFAHAKHPWIAMTALILWNGKILNSAEKIAPDVVGVIGSLDSLLVGIPWLPRNDQCLSGKEGGSPSLIS